MTKPTEAGTWILLSRWLERKPNDSERELAWRRLREQIASGHYHVRYSYGNELNAHRTAKLLDGTLSQNWIWSALMFAPGGIYIHQIEIFLPLPGALATEPEPEPKRGRPNITSKQLIQAKAREMREACHTLTPHAFAKAVQRQVSAENPGVKGLKLTAVKVHLTGLSLDKK